MIKIEETKTYGWEAAIRGMRNPMNSWDKSDSEWDLRSDKIEPEWFYRIGENDHDLMMRLAKGGSVHAKYRRMITVTCDITAPLYWWKEFDTYKVGTVANSCSTMHKIHSKPFALDDFSYDKMSPEVKNALKSLINLLECCRKFYLETNDKQHWHDIIQLLPSSYNQKRTVLMNYEVLVGMYRDRKNHKLDEWRDFCEWIESLPHSELIVGDSIGE